MNTKQVGLHGRNSVCRHKGLSLVYVTIRAIVKEGYLYRCLLLSQFNYNWSPH
jgi:hypothetical protein